MNSNERIRNIRLETGMNRKDFAIYFGIPLRTIEDWEANRRTPPEYIPRMMLYQWRYEQMVKCKPTTSIGKNVESTRNANIVVDTQGHKIVVIHDTIFRNRQNIAWCDVEKYLQQYIGEVYTIIENNEKIYIGKDLPDEYAHSSYTAKLRGSLAKTKANAAQAIPELIEISTNKTYSENMKEKYKLSAQYGWYRYDSRFAMAIYNNSGEVERYNVFRVRLIIRHDADGKNYLYDIINIKKEPSTPLS